MGRRGELDTPRQMKHDEAGCAEGVLTFGLRARYLICSAWATSAPRTVALVHAW